MKQRRLHPGFFTAIWLLPVLVLLQVSAVNRLAVRGIIPSLVLIVIVNWGILRGMDEGMLWAFIGGVCLDCFSGWPFGTNTVALVVIASIVSLGQGTFMRTHALLPLLTVFAATILFYLIALFILESTHHQVDWFPALRDIVLPAAVYNGLFNVILFRLVRRLEGRIYPMPRANW